MLVMSGEVSFELQYLAGSQSGYCSVQRKSCLIAEASGFCIRTSEFCSPS